MIKVKASAIDAKRSARLIMPRTSQQLHSYVRLVLGFYMPCKAIVPGHTAPFSYIEHAFFEDLRPRDCVVWANRGGGKTQLGAIATLLDLLFKPGIEIRILGGSFDQSSKMYRYLKRMLESDIFADLIQGNLTSQSVSLVNGTRVEILSQSQRAVRGQRVHKLRCDEVELFDPEIWEAAQLVTRSGQCGDIFVPASIETLSTMHRPFGLMQSLVKNAESQSKKVMRWGVLDVLEKCPPQRACDTCRLFSDCQGMAKHAQGFISIDDAIQQHTRVGNQTWRSEMLCLEPSRSDSVYGEFDAKKHVVDFEVGQSQLSDTWVGGIDFGYRSPTVLLWAFVDDADVLYIVDELAVREHTTEQIIDQANCRSWPRPEWIGADPAGNQRNEHTGTTTISMWRKAGYTMRYRKSEIESGINAVRRRFKRADGSAALFVHPRCRSLIESLSMYHYPTDKPQIELPAKDGPDHAADALRYLIVNLDRSPWDLKVRTY